MDGEFVDPRPVDRRRDAARIGAGAVALVVCVVWFREQLFDVWPLVWPPTDPMALTLGMVVALSLLLPMMVAAALVDVCYDRLFD